MESDLTKMQDCPSYDKVMALKQQIQELNDKKIAYL